MSGLRIVDRSRCGDDFCAAFYTAPRPVGAYGPGHRTVALVPEKGDIAQIEVLFRDEVKAKIHAAIP